MSPRLKVCLAPLLAFVLVAALVLLYKSMMIVIGPSMKPATTRLLMWINYHGRLPLFVLLLLALLPLRRRRSRRPLHRILSVPVRMMVVLQRGVLLLAVSLLLLLLPFGLLHMARALTASGGDLFREKCSSCHAVSRPMDFLKPETGWEHTVRTMAAKQAGRITEDEQETIVRYLKAMRSHTDRQLFLLKCKGCHLFTDLFEMERSPDQWDRIVDRVSWEDPLWLDRVQAEQIKRYIRGRLPPAGPGSPGVEPDLQRLFEIKCGRCHYLSICLESDLQEEDWGPILRRMHAKCPDYLTPDEADSLRDWLLLEIRDPHSFLRRYPHIDPMGLKDGGG